MVGAEVHTFTGEQLSNSISKIVAETNIARDLTQRMEEHFKRFGTEENGFSIQNAEELNMVVLQRAARAFWQKHPKFWPMFRISGTGCSIEFRRIRQ